MTNLTRRSFIGAAGAASLTLAACGGSNASSGGDTAPAFDGKVTGSITAHVQGYDWVAASGSTLRFTGQTAALVNGEGIRILRQNFGFDPENGAAETVLDPTLEHYYLEICPAAS